MDGPVPRFPAKIPIGLPVSLLQRRADIQQAEFEIGAATARMGSAIADLFPRVAVTSAVGGQGGPRAATGTPITFIGGGCAALSWPGPGFFATYAPSLGGASPGPAAPPPHPTHVLPAPP